MQIRIGTAKALWLATALTVGVLTAGAARAQTDHVDGYVEISRDGDCIVLTEHDGGRLWMFNRGTLRESQTAPARRTRVLAELRNGDHVRLEGHLTGRGACGARQGFEITEVQAIWGDDRHRTTYYDHLKNGTFDRWAERNDRRPEYD